MNASTEEETEPLTPNDDIPTAARDTRRPYQRQLAVYFILLSIVFQLTAYYVLDANMTSTLNQNGTLNWTDHNSSTASYIFEGIEFILMIIFAVISDAKLGRARMIIIGFPFYLIGFTLFTVIANGTTPICKFSETNDGHETSIWNEKCSGVILSTLILTAIGAAAVRSNLFIFGADQIQESKVASRYIDKCVVAIYSADVLEDLIILYMPDGPYFYFYMYILGTSMLFIAVVLFLAGRKYYMHIKPYNSVISNCFPVVFNAFQTWRQYKKKHVVHNLNAPDNFTNEEEETIRTDERPTAFLDFAKVANNGNFQDEIVDDVKSLQNALILFMLVAPYGSVRFQLYSNFRSQAHYMQLPKNDTAIIQWTLLSAPLTIIIGVFILNIFVYQYLRARNRSLTIATKYLIGMCFGFLTMCIAGGVEALRHYQCHENQESSNLSVFFQFPQDIGIGVANLFIMMASLEFAYFAAPRSAQSLFMTLLFFAIVAASYITAGYNYVLRKHGLALNFSCPSTLSGKSHYLPYFLVCGGFHLIFILIFILCQKKFRMIKLNRQKVERDQTRLLASTRSID